MVELETLLQLQEVLEEEEELGKKVKMLLVLLLVMEEMDYHTQLQDFLPTTLVVEEEELTQTHQEAQEVLVVGVMVLVEVM
jgi:hypothetical protein